MRISYKGLLNLAWHKYSCSLQVAYLEASLIKIPDILVLYIKLLFTFLQ